MYWKEFLKPAGWELLRPKLYDWGFLPVQYKHVGRKDVLKNGRRGVHYAEGWEDLYEMIRKFGIFDGVTDDGFPFLKSYKGPTLKPNNRESKWIGGGGGGTNDSSRKGLKKMETLEQEKQQHGKLIFTVKKGNPETCRKLVSCIPEDVWHHKNPIPYKYFEKVLEDTRNNIFIGERTSNEKKGKDGNTTEICSIFAYRTSGFDQKDATVTLLWTKTDQRRKGFSTQLIRFGIQFLTDDSLIMSGAAPTTKYSECLFESQRWDKVDGHGFLVGIQKLRRTLEEKGRTYYFAATRSKKKRSSTTSKSGDDCWEVKIEDSLMDQSANYSQGYQSGKRQETVAPEKSNHSTSSTSSSPLSTSIARCISDTTNDSEDSDASSFKAGPADVSPRNNAEKIHNTNQQQADITKQNQASANFTSYLGKNESCNVVQFDTTNSSHKRLLDLVRGASDCIKGDYKEFCAWLIESEDIHSIDDLKEAIMDDEYVRDDLQKGNGIVGLKGFKRKTFQRFVASSM